MTLAPSAVTAKWRRPNDIFFGTAYTLPEDRMRIGLFAPLSYGVHERVTLSSHPILALLLTPNASARIKLVDKRVVVSLAAAYTQSFYVNNEDPASGQTRFFGIATLPVTERFLLTTTGGVAQNLTDDARSVEASLCAHYRLDQQNIIMIQGAISNTLNLDDDTTARGLFFYALAFDSFKAGAGLAVGKMPESLASIPLKDDELRAIPYVDIWWSF